MICSCFFQAALHTFIFDILQFHCDELRCGFLLDYYSSGVLSFIISSQFLFWKIFSHVFENTVYLSFSFFSSVTPARYIDKRKLFPLLRTLRTPNTWGIFPTPTNSLILCRYQLHILQFNSDLTLTTWS